MSSATSEHMPFKGHRTVAEVIASERDQLPWCPHEFRDRYRTLRRKGWRASVARRMIEEEIRLGQRRAA